MASLPNGKYSKKAVAFEKRKMMQRKTYPLQSVTQHKLIASWIDKSRRTVCEPGTYRRVKQPCDQGPACITAAPTQPFIAQMWRGKYGIDREQSNSSAG